MRKNDRERAITVILPFGESLDGSGGAIAHWVHRVSNASEHPHQLFTSGAATLGFEMHVDVRQGALRRRRTYTRSYLSEKTLESRLGRVYKSRLATRAVEAAWIAAVSISARQHNHVIIHNRPKYALLLRSLGFRGRVTLHMHNDIANYMQGVSRAHLLASVDTYLFCSDYLRLNAESLLGPLPEGHTIYNGADEPEDSLLYCDNPQPPRLVFTGRIIPEKGALRAIRLFGRLENYRNLGGILDVFGSTSGKAFGPPTTYWQDVNDAAAAVNEAWGYRAVRIHGHATRDQVESHYAKATAFLYPCSWEEPFGMVLVEAMSCGLPVVASHRGGIPEVVGDDLSGFAVNTDAEFEDRCNLLLNHAYRAQISLASRKRFLECFTWGAVAARYDAFVALTASKKGSGGSHRGTH